MLEVMSEQKLKIKELEYRIRTITETNKHLQEERDEAVQNN
jgi:hypothetical protein